jgi:hypothetical protein
MATALYRDKEGRVVYEFPFILLIDPIMNQGAIYQDTVALDDAFADDDLMDGSTPDTVMPRLAARGFRVYYLRSEADMEDELLPYFAIADGQLQEALASLWLQQDFEFPGAEHIDWDGTTTRLYTDGERLICEGHQVTLTLPEGHPDRAALEARARDFLEAFAGQVASELRTTLRHVTVRPR